VNHKILDLPWVKQLKGREAPPCEGIKWGQVSLKHLHSFGGRPAEGIPDRAHCKLKARYTFKALPSSYAKSGKYCWHHLAQQVNLDEEETARILRWVKRQEAKQ
jgi:hypothetical protein